MVAFLAFFQFLFVPWIISFVMSILILMAMLLFVSSSNAGIASHLSVLCSALACIALILYANRLYTDKWRVKKETMLELLTEEMEKLRSVFLENMIDIILFTSICVFLVFGEITADRMLTNTEEPDIKTSLFIIVALFLGPLSEELFFRRVFFQKNEKVNKKWLILISALFFALYHSYAINLFGFFYFAKNLLLGFLLSYCYAKYKSVFACIALHAFANTLIFIENKTHVISMIPAIYALIIPSLIIVAILIVKKYKLLFRTWPK